MTKPTPEVLADFEQLLVKYNRRITELRELGERRGCKEHCECGIHKHILILEDAIKRKTTARDKLVNK